MKIAVVGAGAIGGTLGARLSLAGDDVAFIARNRNLAAIAANGMRLILEDGSTLHAKSVRAVGDAAELGPQDAVLLAVKAHQVPDVLPALGRLVGEATTLVTMTNGIPWWYFQRLPGPWQGRTLDSVDPGGVLAGAIDPERIVGSVVYPAAELVEPGVVRVVVGNRFSLGELDGTKSARIEALARAFMAAGFKAPVTRDIRSEIWLKLWGNLSFNPVSALSHATLGAIGRDPDGRALVETMMREAQAVAERLGVVFKVGIEQRIAGAVAIGEHKTSMLQDVEHGRALELDALVGSVLELARITATPVPAIEAIHRACALLARTLAANSARLALAPARWLRATTTSRPIRTS
ncbi:MAG: 2-dehydropantoate 2-reductase [Caldimonas sp.]